jgi:glycosyltransferase involved in cell wall biosynthesis
LGFIGSLCYHSEAGIESLKDIAYYLRERNVDFVISIIGEGPGMEILKHLLRQDKLENYFHFYGWLRPQNAFLEIINFDFGILPWTICESNIVHTAAKLMDYMCCASPVCTLKLHEQIKTTDNIGIHTETFEEMVDKIVETYSDKELYEDLRAKTLARFNNTLCWEKQEAVLLNGYYELSKV